MGRCPIGIGQARHLGPSADAVVTKNRHRLPIAVEAGEIDFDRDHMAIERRGKAIPEVLGGKLTRGVRQRRVEHKAESVKQVGLAGSILADDHVCSWQVRQLESTEVSKVVNRYPAYVHDG